MKGGQTVTSGCLSPAWQPHAGGGGEEPLQQEKHCLAASRWAAPDWWGWAVGLARRKGLQEEMSEDLLFVASQRDWPWSAVLGSWQDRDVLK